eukprot:761380-Alexandrium_andersonii.AAC.1
MAAWASAAGLASASATPSTRAWVAPCRRQPVEELGGGSVGSGEDAGPSHRIRTLRRSGNMAPAK